MIVKNLRESLSRFDLKALDENTKYYDFVNLYEAAKPLTNDEKKILTDATKTGNPDLVDQAFTQIKITRDPKYKVTSHSTQSVPTASVEEQLARISEEETFNEGRYNLKPVKCHAILSKKAYWSPYDTKEQQFAEYGTRFRYETKDACMDAINDPENNLGYTKEKKKREADIEEAEISSDEKLTEANQNIEPEVVVSKALEDSVLKMTKSGTKASTGVPYEIWYAIKLYQLTNNGTDLTKAVPREKLLMAAGVPEVRAQIYTQAQVQLRDLEKDGLLILSGKDVYATSELKPWIEGTNTFERGESDIDFRKYIGSSKDPEMMAAREPQYGPHGELGNSEKSRAGMKYKTKKVTTIDSEEPSVVSAEEPEEVIEPEESESKPEVSDRYTVDLSFFESLEEDHDDLESAADRLKREAIDMKKKTYREYAGLGLDEEITEDNLQDWTFKHMCSMHGWPYESTKKELLSR